MHRSPWVLGVVTCFSFGLGCGDSSAEGDTSVNTNMPSTGVPSETESGDEMSTQTSNPTGPTDTDADTETD